MIKIDKCYYSADDEFSIHDSKGQLTSDYCRESVYNNWLEFSESNRYDVKKLYLVYQCKDALQSSKIKSFIKKIERRLKLKTKTKFVKTNRKNTIGFSLSKFWHEPVRFSLFLALVRAGKNYVNSWKKTLKKRLSSKYVNYFQNRDAINRFMSGYTKINIQQREVLDCPEEDYPENDKWERYYYITGWQDYVSSFKGESLSKLLTK